MERTCGDSSTSILPLLLVWAGHGDPPHMPKDSQASAILG